MKKGGKQRTNVAARLKLQILWTVVNSSVVLASQGNK